MVTNYDEKQVMMRDNMKIEMSDQTFIKENALRYALLYVDKPWFKQECHRKNH